MWMYVYFGLAIAIAILVGKNANETGHGFWRSFIFVLLIFAVVLAFLVKQFNG
jgi:glucan phosphoethanolaminetransferase (alkaline phosphatase superfamily)